MSNPYRLRAALLAGAAVCAAAATASAQTASNIQATQLLLPFSTLLNTPEGRAALAANLETTVQVNRTSTAEQRARAIADNELSQDGVSMSHAMGDRLSAVYETGAQTSGSVLAPGSAAAEVIRGWAGVVVSDAGVSKSFYGNGTTNNTTPYVGVSLPAGGQYDVYDRAYGVTPYSLNPNGNSRPYMVARDRITFFAPSIQGGRLDSSSAFPSGHAASSYAYGIAFALLVPEAGQDFLYEAALESHSRLVLGVHYPLDVIGGRIIATYDYAQFLLNNPAYTDEALPATPGSTGGRTSADTAATFARAYNEMRAYLQAGCGGTIAFCYGSGPSDAEYAQMRAEYLYMQTYNLPPVGPTNLAPVVPTGAEVLLATRFPYLTAAQRREVIATTELPSGAPLDDGSGWARINLFDAYGGYGALNGVVTVNMDASRGDLNAYDTWRNSIGGTGSLVKTGTGVLALRGQNTFTGPITINGGGLAVIGAGSLNPSITINNNATFSLADGSGTGNVTVGNYVGGPGSTLLVDFGDHLTINGATVGASNLVVGSSTGGLGAVNQAGPVTAVTTNNPGAFTMAGNVQQDGLYEYRLTRGANTVNLVMAPSADGHRVGTIATAMEEIFSSTSEVWQERQAAQRDGAAPDRGAWITGYGRWSERDQSTGYDMATAGVMGGVDITFDNRLFGMSRFGVMAGVVEAEQDFSNSTMNFAYEGFTFGAAGSFGGEAGLFGEVNVKGDFLRVRLRAPNMAGVTGGAQADGGANNYGALATVGYRRKLNGGGFLEPLAGLSYFVADDSLIFANNLVAWDSGDGLRGRLGVRGGMPLSPALTLTGQAMAWSTFTSDAGASFDGRNGVAPGQVEDDAPEAFGELGAGLSYQAGPWSAALRGTYRAGSDYQAQDLSVAVRLVF